MISKKQSLNTENLKQQLDHTALLCYHRHAYVSVLCNSDDMRKINC